MTFSRSIESHLALSWNEPPHDKTNKMACAPSADSDQPGHPPSLIRVFAVRMKNAWALSYPLSGKRRLWSDWVDAQPDLSLRWTHMPLCWFCHEAAQISFPLQPVFKSWWWKIRRKKKKKKKRWIWEKLQVVCVHVYQRSCFFFVCLFFFFFFFLIIFLSIYITTVVRFKANQSVH